MSIHIIMMVKNLSVKCGIILAVLLYSSICSMVPVPTCNYPRFELQTFPISIYETQRYDTTNIFSGYNLDVSILSKPQFVSLKEKVVITKTQEKAQPGLKNYHLGHEGNQWTWTSSLVTISNQNGATRLRWGVAAENSSAIPNLAFDMIVENDTNTSCYDAVWFRQETIALIDCAMKIKDGKALQNVFIYVNTTTKTVISKLNNSMYAPFTVIWHRKIQLLNQNGYRYLIRAHFAENVDESLSTNTYAEIISVNNPLKPWTMRVMDRSFLHQDKLSITDFQVYMGDIYILDYHSGVIKFDISPAQTILIVGRYRTDSGFTRLGVYGNNLDRKSLLVLAHDHAIFEVDWSNQIFPETIAKYSIPDGSWIHDLWVNQQYVIVQLTANLTDKNGKLIQTNSTYVLNRGTRTYLNAFSAIPHGDRHAFVDFNRYTSQMLTIDTERLVISQLNNPTIIVRPQNSELLDKEFSFTVKALSKNEYTGESLPCLFSFKFVVVKFNYTKLYPTGFTLPETYYSNFPGELFVPLDRYINGPNITYGVLGSTDKYDPVYYILQQNTTKLTWNKTPSVSQYVFLRQEQYDSLGETELYLYAQDANNVTHFSRCVAVPYTQTVKCNERGFAEQINFRVANITANRFLYYEDRYLHLVAILYRDLPNQVFIYDVQRNATPAAKPIQFPSGFEGKIASVQFLGQYLVVVLRYMKQIVFFDMNQCYAIPIKQCQAVFRINAENMTTIGVEYFSPVQVYVSQFHPYVLFVQCLDRVVILDFGRRGISKLAQIMSPATKQPGFYKWKLAIARGQLLLVNPPITIQEYDLDQIYTTRNVTLTKSFPTYNYFIPDKFDLDFSDSGNLVYVTGKDPSLPANKNAIIMVYRTGYPAVSSFYDVFQLNSNFQDVLIDATGNFGDYIAVTNGTDLIMFRQYEIPIVVIQDTFSDYSFDLTYTNDPTGKNYSLAKCTVKIANYPQDILINDTKINQTSYLTDSIKYNNDAKYYSFDDETWFNGSIINYTLYNCPQCNDKIKVINHVQQERIVLGTLGMEDYAFGGPQGGFIQQKKAIIKMQNNGSIDQFVTFPSVLDGEQCFVIEHNWIYDFTISACKQGQAQVYLYTTVYTSFKPFVNGPYYSSAKHVTSMNVLQDLMIIADVDENPWVADREGSVIIYAINHDPFDPEIFDELEIINTQDLSTATGWTKGPCYIGNAHFDFTNVTDLYRLVITQRNNGFFVLDFKWVKGRKSVQILKIQFIDMKEEMINKNVPLPNAAYFLAIAISSQFYEQTHGYYQTEVIVSTFGFHSFQVNLLIDSTGTIVDHQIVKIFYRYGFYENQNYIKTFDGYFAIPQRLPTRVAIFDYSPMVLSVYDTREHWTLNSDGESQKTNKRYLEGTNVQLEYMLGGFPFGRGRVTFDWNFTWTRNASDPFRRIGLLALQDREARIRELRVHQKLIIQTLPGIVVSQEAKLRAQNDYHYLDIPFKVIIDNHDPVPDDDSSSFPGWAIALIVVGGVAAISVGGYLVYLRTKKRPLRESQAEKSLLEKEAEQEDGQQKDPDDDDSGSEEGQEGEEQEDQQTEQESVANKKPNLSTEVQPQPAAQPINESDQVQQSISSEAKPEQEKPKVDQ